VHSQIFSCRTPAPRSAAQTSKPVVPPLAPESFYKIFLCFNLAQEPLRHCASNSNPRALNVVYPIVQRGCPMHGTAPVPHKEMEVKLDLAPANLPDLKKIPLLRTIKSAPKGAPQVSVYFDTKNQKLRKNGLMLRVRREGRHHTQTIKATANAGQFERDEWE